MDGYVVRLDRATGEVLWSSPYLGEQAHSSPAVAADIQTAVVGSNNGYLTALNTETGAFLWRVLLAGPIKATPLIYENVAYATSWDGEIVAAALESGAVIWKQTLPGGSMSTPVPIPSLNMIIVGGRDGHWWAFHTKSGKQLWHRHWVVDDPQISTPLAMSFGAQRKEWRVWLTCGIHRLCLLDAATGKVVSDLAMGARLTGTPVAYGRRLWLALGSQGPLLGLDWTQN